MMDFTIKFIRMCERLKELQEIKMTSIGLNLIAQLDRMDIYWIPSAHKIDFVKDDFVQLKFGSIVWLPRQDQLFEIVWNEKLQMGLIGGKYARSAMGILNEVAEWAEEKYFLYSHNFKTLQQLLLAWVASIKWGLVWNDEKETWEKEK